MNHATTGNADSGGEPFEGPPLSAGRGARLRDRSVPRGIQPIELSAASRSRPRSRTRGWPEDTTKIPRLSRERGDSTFPASFEQERILLLDRGDPGGAAQNESIAFRIDGAVDTSALEGAVRALIDRHEALRTRFVLSGGTALQIVAPTIAFAFSRTDLTGAAGDRDAQALAIAAADACAPFDLGRGPLLRARLVRIGREAHLVSLTMHRIITDAWSLEIFRRELAELYGALSRGRPSPLPELPIQIADHSVWQRGQLCGGAIERELAFWRTALAGELPILDLPTDRPRAAARTHRGARQARPLPAALTRAIRAFAAQHDVTTGVVLDAAFRVVLHRWSGQDDLIVGAEATGRGRIESHGLLGRFAHPLPIRTDLADDPSFRALLGRVGDALRDGAAHEDVPFAELAAIVGAPRDGSGAPLLQVAFELRRRADHHLDWPRLCLDPVDLDPRASSFDLALAAIEERHTLTLTLNHSVDLFDGDTAATLLGHLQTLLEGVLRDPDRRIGDYALLTGAERRARDTARAAMIVAPPLAAPVARQTIEAPLHRRFEEQARLSADRLAVDSGSTRWTYAELNQRANRLARSVVAHAGSDEANVALLFDHGAPMIAALLAALKAGKAYVPLEPSHPRARLDFLLADAEARAILAGPRETPQALALAAGRLPVITVGDEDPLGCADDLDLAVAPDALAYLLYTSGSTGRPKGVMQSHRNVNHFIRAYADNLAIGAGDRLSLLASLSVDAAVMDVFGALLVGAELHPIDPTAGGLGALARRLEAQRITVYHSTPTLYRHLLAAAPDGRRFPHVRLVVLGGEAAMRRDLEAFRERFPERAVLVNGLGPTESTVTLQGFFNASSRVVGSALPIGEPVRETEILLLDPEGKPHRSRGEIAIRSEFTALGYWRSPELTAAAFLPDPEGLSRRIYRTGDLARRLPDGQLEFLGRLDDQVKIGGVRVEPAEIEAALSEHPAVREAVVVARRGASPEGSLVAYVVAPGNCMTAIERFLRDRLPASLIPATFVALDALPLTPAGKVDRRALPAPTPPATPRSPSARPTPHVIERRLQRIWARILGADAIGLQEDFFDRGGTSRLALELFVAIEGELGKALPLSTLFRAPTIASLAAVIAREGGASTSASLVPIQPRGGGRALFCVHAVGESGLACRSLARDLGEQQRFYGLQSRGLDAAHPPHESVEEMAACYLDELRAIEPRGPYLLGGFFSGGIIAWEMAQQLLAAGEEVALLALVDTACPRNEPAAAREPGLRSRILRLAFHLDGVAARLLLREGDDRLGWLADEARRWIERTAPPALRLLRRDAEERTLPPWLQRVHEAGGRALRGYTPKPYPGRATLFLTLREPVRQLDDRRLAWSELCRGGLEIQTLPGDHDTALREPGVATLAEKLRGCITRATASSS